MVAGRCLLLFSETLSLKVLQRMRMSLKKMMNKALMMKPYYLEATWALSLDAFGLLRIGCTPGQ